MRVPAQARTWRCKNVTVSPQASRNTRGERGEKSGPHPNERGVCITAVQSVASLVQVPININLLAGWLAGTINAQSRQRRTRTPSNASSEEGGAYLRCVSPHTGQGLSFAVLPGSNARSNKLYGGMCVIRISTPAGIADHTPSSSVPLQLNP